MIYLLIILAFIPTAYYLGGLDQESTALGHFDRFIAGSLLLIIATGAVLLICAALFGAFWGAR